MWPPLTHGIHGFAYTGEYPIPTIEAPLQRSPTYQGKVSEKSNGNYVDNINGKDCDTLHLQEFASYALSVTKVLTPIASRISWRRAMETV